MSFVPPKINPCLTMSAESLTNVVMTMIDNHSRHYSAKELRREVKVLVNITMRSLTYLRDMHEMDFDMLGFSDMCSFVGVIELERLPELDDVHKVLLDTYIGQWPSDTREAYIEHDKIHSIIAEVIEAIELGVEMPYYPSDEDIESMLDDMESGDCPVIDKSKLN